MLYPRRLKRYEKEAIYRRRIRDGSKSRRSFDFNPPVECERGVDVSTDLMNRRGQ